MESPVPRPAALIGWATPKTIWRLCKASGKLIGYPSSSRTTCATALPSRCWSNDTTWKRCARFSANARIDTTLIYTKIRPPQLKRAVAFYEDGAERLLGVEAVSGTSRVSRTVDPGSRNIRMLLKPGS
jgi:hypothetical protein